MRFVRGRWYNAPDGYPAAETGLRNAGDEIFVIVETSTPGAPVFDRATRTGNPFDSSDRPKPATEPVAGTPRGVGAWVEPLGIARGVGA